MHILLKDLLKDLLKEQHDENEEYASLNSVKDINDKVLDDMVAAAQKEYDEWVVDADGNDAEVGAGGICHLIADKLISALSDNNIHNCQSVCSTHEQHVYVVGQFKEGIYEIDIPYSIYETGGGYSWKKIPDIEFNRNSIVIHRLSSDPSEINTYAGEMNEIIKEDRFDGDAYFSREAMSHAGRSTTDSDSTNILIRMSPDDFLSMAQEMAPEYKEYSDSEAKKLQDLMESGVKMSGVLFLAFIHDGEGTAYVTGHEGRHRAKALKNMGVEGVPVLLISQKGKGQLIKWNQQEDPSERGYFKEIWPTKLKGEAGKGTEIDFPVTWENVTN